MWFCLGNTVLFFLIGWRYLPWIIPTHFDVITPFNTVISWAFIITAFAGHFALLAFIPGILLLLPLILLFPDRRLIFPIAFPIAALAALALLIDTYVFTQYHLHLNGIVLELFFSGAGHQIFDFSWLEWLIATGLLIGFFVLETCYGLWLFRKLSTIPARPYEKNILYCLFGCLCFSHLMFLFSGIQPEFKLISQQPQAFPLYNSILSALLPGKGIFKDLETLGGTQFTQPDKVNTTLRYPLHPLQCTTTTKPLNLVIITIDAWRFDMLTPQVTPHLAALAQKSWQFTQHFSGGNGTQAGIFSLFYGLPNNYWTAMLKQQRGPLLLDELLKRQYQTGIFASAPLTAPAFNKTVFREISTLPTKTPGETALERDRFITQQFQQFLANAHRTPQAFFGFLFYDLAHSFCDGKDIAGPFKPVIKNCNRFGLDEKANPIPYLNLYKNALFTIDQQIGKVLTTLKKHRLLDHTIIIVTGDHGQEFNDNQEGFWGHAGNFTRYQVQTPLILYWPSKQPKIFSHLTSHYDVAPTLMRHLAHCTNPASDYSIGKELTSTKQPGYLISHGYVDFGIIEKDRITNIFATGNYEISDVKGRLMRNAKLRVPIVKQVLAEQQRFFQQEKAYAQK